MDTSTPPHNWAGFAKNVVRIATANTPAPALTPPADADPNRAHSGVFVTLHRAGRLRGCMGTLDPSPPLIEAVRSAALSAALHDPRFPPVTAEELSDLDVEVSVLSPPTAMRSLDDLVLGKHGIIIQAGPRRGLFLPQVATDHHFDKETFLARCCSEKAGLAPDAWRDPATTVQLFTAEKYR